jgi:Arylsulfatase A and related enzymes
MVPMTFKRIVIATVEGLTTESIRRLSLFNLTRLVDRGAVAMNIESCTSGARAARFATLMSGVSQERHGVMAEKFNFTRRISRVETVPQCISATGFQVSAFLPAMPDDRSSRARFICRELGFQEIVCKGRNASEIVSSALNTLCTQRRGLIAIQFPDLASLDAHRKTPEVYAETARQVDKAIGILASLSGSSSGESLLVLLADEAAGNGDVEHRNFSLILSGRNVRSQLLERVVLEDIPATILGALGISPPRSYEGRELAEAFHGSFTMSTALSVG